MEDMFVRMRSWRRGALVAALSAAMAACGGGRPASAEGRTPAPSRPGQALRETAQAAAPAPAPAQATNPVPIPSGGSLPSMAPLVESVKAAVINVEVRSRASGQMNDAARELWDRFFGGQIPEGRQREQFQRGLGSGFLISPDGLALTNNHVVEGAVAINVRLDDGRQFDAEVLGRDPLTDVAVIKLKGKVGKLPALALGDSDALRVGDWVMAIGNPFGLASTVSAGIISAKAREIGAGPYDDFLQTDAAINPGNSGGPLFNLRGEVIGINTAIVGGANGMAATGIGFAVPSNMIKSLLPQLEKSGVVTRGYIGVSVQNLTADLARGLGVPVQEGALVSNVSGGSPGEKGGIKTDDVITKLDGETIASSGQLTRKVALRRPGTAVTLEVYRGGNKMEKKVTLGTRPDLEGISARERNRGGGEEDQRQEKIGLVVRDAGPGTGGAGEEEEQGEEMPQAQGIEGAVIVEVKPGSAAEHANLVPGMVIVEAGGKPVRTAAELRKILRGAKAGSTVLIRVAVGREGRVLRALTIPD
jgi:serine protease Do